MHSKKKSLECMIISPQIYSDNRGIFFEKYNQKYFKVLGITQKFVQDNVSQSKKNVLRGLHFQKKFPQGKLIKVLKGKIFDVAVDLRKTKSTFRNFYTFTLSDKDHRSLWVPPGFAHGFCVLSKSAIVEYKCTNFYRFNDQFTLKWDDEDLNINWPIRRPIVSKKDKIGLSLKYIINKKLYL